MNWIKEKFAIRLPQFEGPFDLLLFFIERDELDIEFSRLQLEQATWAETNRIEQVAVERIHMVFPATSELVVLRP